jgi:hypothetical protein
LLQRADVLVLVDDEVPVLLPDGVGDVRVVLQHAGGDEQDVLEVDDPALGLDVLVDLQHPRHGGGVQPGRVAAGPPCCGGYVSGVNRLTLAHSTSLARSRTAVRSRRRRSREAASATRPALCGITSGAAPPMACGQKKCSCLSAAAWKVRACTPATPSSRRRVRISPAARAVKVTASTCWGV